MRKTKVYTKQGGKLVEVKFATTASVIDLDGYKSLPTTSIPEITKSKSVLEALEILVANITKNKNDADSTYLHANANAVSATKLKTGATINGVAFDGSKAITITADPNTHKHPASQITGLNSVATSGKYSDLSGAPTKVSDFTNDTGFITSADSITGNAATATKADEAKVLREAEGSQSTVGIQYSGSCDNTAAYCATWNGNTVKCTDWSSVRNKLDVPSTLPANGGNADTVNNLTVETAVPPGAVFTDTTYDDVTQSTHGLMTAKDKIKLDGLHSVASSGNYSELNDKPTNLNQFTNGPGFITKSASITGNAATATKLAATVNINGVPFDGSKAITITADPNTHKHPASQVTGLSTVATSGAYFDLTGTPTKVSDFTNDIGFITSADSITGNAATATKLETGRTIKIHGAITGKAIFDGTKPITIDTTLSNFDASKITTGVIDIARLPKLAVPVFKIVTDDNARFKLTAEDVQVGDTVKVTSTGKLYLVIDSSKLATSAGYTEYTASSASSVPWSGVTDKPDTFTPSTHGHTASQISGLATVATSGAYGDLSGKPTNVSQFTNNAGYITKSASITGNAATATKLAAPVNINGVPFDGSKAITITADPNTHKHPASQITGLNSVATSGKYSDLSGTPTHLPADGGNSATVNGLTVETAVPPNAKFTDTTYSDATQLNHGLMSINDKKKLDGLATVATSGSYDDLSNTPKSLPANGGNAATVNNLTVQTAVPLGAKFTDTTYSDVTQSTHGLMTAKDKIKLDNLATVATSGSYTDLTNQPESLPANGGNADTVNNHTVLKNVPANAKFTDTTYEIATTLKSGLMSATDKSKIDGLHSVASSGAYSDLSGTPTKVSDFTNDTGFITSTGSITGNAATATKLENGVKINGVPFDGSKAITITAAPDSHTHPASQVTGLSAVATSGKYSDLSGKPTNLNQFTNGPGYITSSASISGNAATATKLASATNIAVSGAVTGTASYQGNSDITINTTLSNFDASKITTGVIDIARLPKLAVPVFKTVTDDNARFKLTAEDVQVGDTVKVTSTGKLYLVIDSTKLSTSAGYTEYTASSASSVPWSGVTDKPDTFTPSTHGHSASQISGLATVATSGAYGDLSGKPTNVSQFTNNAGYITKSASITGNAATATKLAATVNINGVAFDGSKAITITADPNTHKHPASQVTGLATVATSGSYNSLSNTPKSLPADGGNADTVNNLTVETAVPVNAKFTDTTYSDATQLIHGLMSIDDKIKLDGLATVASSGKYSDLTGKPSNLNQFTNGPGYITSSGSITGNAATATKLKAGASINGVSFDGSKAITISAAPTSHYHDADDITSMTSYQKAVSVSPIGTNDSLTTALGKLEKAIDGKQDSGNYSVEGHTHDASKITGLAKVALTGKFSDLTWIPKTMDGYGISDGLTIYDIPANKNIDTLKREGIYSTANLTVTQAGALPSSPFSSTTDGENNHLSFLIVMKIAGSMIQQIAISNTGRIKIRIKNGSDTWLGWTENLRKDDIITSDNHMKLPSGIEIW